MAFGGCMRREKSGGWGSQTERVQSPGRQFG